MAFLGAVSAAYFDLIYTAPAIAAAFTAARHTAAGRPISHLSRTAAFRRWAIYSSGFLAVFAPVRAMIAYRCSQRLCYSGSGVNLPDLPGELGGLAAGRALTGLPPAGWSHTSELLSLHNREFGFTDFATNSLLVLLSAAIVILALRTAGRAIRPSRPTRLTAAAAGKKHLYLRLASCLGAFGAVTVLIPSVVRQPVEADAIGPPACRHGLARDRAGSGRLVVRYRSCRAGFDRNGPLATDAETFRGGGRHDSRSRSVLHSASQRPAGTFRPDCAHFRCHGRDLDVCHQYRPHP